MTPVRDGDWFWWVQTRVFGVFILCLGVVTVALTLSNQVAQGRAQERANINLACQNVYNERNAEALKARTDAAAKDRVANGQDRASAIAAEENILALLNAVAASQVLPEDEQAAEGARIYRTFLARAEQIKADRAATDRLRQQADATRNENPLPPAACPAALPTPTGSQL